jgi:CheY-like chemotaxis protein
MDLQMPGMDGMAATKAIRANCELNRATPILALSANVLPEQIAACAAAGMDDHVAKPISPGDLLNKIARWTAVQPQGSDAARRGTAA